MTAVQIGDCTLYHASCFDCLPQIESADAIIVDPPYGIAFDGHGQWFRESNPITGDHSTDTANCIRSLACERGIPLAMFYSPYRPLAGFRSVLVWAKGAHVGIGGDRETCWKRDFELIGVENNGELGGQRDSAVIRINAVSPPPSTHFAEKPVDLMQYLIDKIGGDTICDPCFGSGATAEACVRTGKRFVGMEIEERWFRYTCRRIEKAYAKKSNPLFGEVAPKAVQLELGK